MAETSWTEEADHAPKKRTIPPWIWFCGAGCLIAAILGIVVTLFVVQGVKKALDPEKQWARLGEVLPYDQRPEGWKLTFGFPGVLGFEMFMLAHPSGVVANLMHFSGEQADEARSQLFDEEFTGSAFGFGGRKDLRKGTIEVQGRELVVMRYHQVQGFRGSERDAQPETEPGAEPAAEEGASALVDLTPPGDPDGLFLMMIRARSGEPFSDEEVQDFLEPFHVGPH